MKPYFILHGWNPISLFKQQNGQRDRVIKNQPTVIGSWLCAASSFSTWCSFECGWTVLTNPIKHPTNSNFFLKYSKIQGTIRNFETKERKAKTYFIHATFFSSFHNQCRIQILSRQGRKRSKLSKYLKGKLTFGLVRVKLTQR